MRHRLPALLLIGMVPLASCACVPARETDVIRVETADIDRFYATLRAQPEDASVEQLATALQRDYLDKGTIGLQDFLRLRIESAEDLAKTVRARRAYYEAVEAPLTDEIVNGKVRERVVDALEWVRERKPDAEFPDVYIVIGRMNSAGTTSERAQLIGGEMFGRAPGVPTHELSDWAKENIPPTADLARVIVHEAIHTVQPTPTSNTLLTAVVREGACDFVAFLAIGEDPPGQGIAYLRRHIGALWPEFEAMMTGSDFGEWLYTKPVDADRPTDLGYSLGYLICEAYYERADDKGAAVRAIIEMTDANAFLRDSGFLERIGR